MNKDNTPYDDVFRTMASRCSPLLLPLLNEVFGTHYTGEETIRFHPNEFFTDRPGGKQEEYITDTYFDVLPGDDVTDGADDPYGVTDGTGCPPGRKHRYHLECQSTADRTILVRIFQYDALIAMQSGELEGNTLHVTFPRSAVLYLRGSGGTPDSLRLFALFLYEKELTVQGKMTEHTKWMILEMTQKVVTNLARKQENVAREVNHTMRGPIIMTESSRIFDSGVLVGEQRGEKRGIKIGEKRGICNSIDIAMSMGVNTGEAIQRVAGQYKMDTKEVKEIWENRAE